MTVEGNNLEEDENRRISRRRVGCIVGVVLAATFAQQQPGIGDGLAIVLPGLLPALALPVVGGLDQIYRDFRRTPFWPAVGWAALGIVTYYLSGMAFDAAVQPRYE